MSEDDILQEDSEDKTVFRIHLYLAWEICVIEHMNGKRRAVDCHEVTDHGFFIFM